MSPHRSRTAWAPPLSIGDAGTRELSRSTRLLMKLMVFGIVALMVTVGSLIFFVYQQQQYIEGKGDQRDRENAEMNQRITDRFCELLSFAPADDPQADYYREQLDCPQPGVATADLPPAVRQQFDGTRPTVQPPAAVQPPTPDLGSPAVPDPPRPPANTPGPASPEPAAPTPEPTGPLDPITEPLCEGLGICV